MAQAVVIGRVTSELELKTSTNHNPYLRLSLAERIGYGETARMEYYQVWAWGSLAHQLEKCGVTKGSFIMASGFLELTDYVKKDGVTKDKQLKLTLKAWEFVPSAGCRKHSLDTQDGGSHAPEKSVPSVPIIDGERDVLPE